MDVFYGLVRVGRAICWVGEGRWMFFICGWVEWRYILGG